MANQRLDQRLVELSLAPSRAKAKALIQEGSVEVNTVMGWQTAKSASQAVSPDVQVRVRASDILKYVSRSGLKLEGAFSDSGCNPQGARCLDVGQSTGGFTDCCLKMGAKSVLGLDVGSGQLHQCLREDARVSFFEGLNAKDVSTVPEIMRSAGEIDLLICDVSFISLKKALPECLKLLAPAAELLLLVKPQFELGKEYLNKSGIVVGENIEDTLKKDFFTWVEQVGLTPIQFFPSRVKGQDGNQEYFIYAKKQSQ